ncbi:MAG: CvpA family protein [Rhizomicrobium sp.]
MNLTVIDIVVGLVLLISTVYAVLRGFLAETLAIFAWIAAIFGAFYLGPYLEPWMHRYIATHWLAVTAADAAMFLIVFVPLSFFSRRIAGSVKNSAIGPLDRVLGLAFGVVRGLVILGLAYMAFAYFVPVRDRPATFARSRSLPLLEKSATLLRSLAPRDAYSRFKGDELGALIRRNDGPAVPAHMPDMKAAQAAKGYGVKARRALDSLIEARGGGGSGK